MPGTVVVLVATPRQTDIPRIPCGLERKQDNNTAIDARSGTKRPFMPPLDAVRRDSDCVEDSAAS